MLPASIAQPPSGSKERRYCDDRTGIRNTYPLPDRKLQDRIPQKQILDARKARWHCILHTAVLGPVGDWGLGLLLVAGVSSQSPHWLHRLKYS